MKWQRNTTGLQKAAQKKRLEAYAKVEQAIQQLLKQKRPINFGAVAKAAGVSRSWLYKQPQLKERINYLRDQPRNLGASLDTQASEASKEAVIQALRVQLKQRSQDIVQLNQRLEVAYGLAYQCTPEALANENQRLIQAFEKIQLMLNQAIQDKQALNQKSQQLRSQVQELQAQLIAMNAMADEINQLKQQNQNLFNKLMQFQSVENALDKHEGREASSSYRQLSEIPEIDF